MIFRAFPSAAVKDVVNSLLNAQRAPKEKYEDPVTSAHAVGWYSKPLVAPNTRFQYGLKQAEGTKFAETYTRKMAGMLQTNILFVVASSRRSRSRQLC